MKQFLLSLFTFLIIISVKSQSTISVLDPSVEKKSFSHFFHSFNITSSDDNYYIYRASSSRTSKSLFISKSLNNDCIYILNNDLSLKSKSTIDIPKDIAYLFSYETPDAIIGIYGFDEYNDNNYVIYMNKYDKTETSYQWNPTQIGNFSYESNDKYIIKTALSPDRSKFALLFALSDNHEAFKGWITALYNSNGENEWEYSFAPDFHHRSFSTNLFTVTNEGELFLMINSYIDNKKNSSDEEINIFSIEENHHTLTTETTPNIIAASNQLIQLKNGSIFISGYYKTEPNEPFAGYYSLSYDPKLKTINAFNHQEFPSNYFGIKVVEDKANHYANQQYNIIPINMFELDNGNVVLLSEHQLMNSIRDMRTNTLTFNYFTKNIIYNCFDSKGEILSLKLFDKAQFTSTSYYNPDFSTFNISFYPYQEGNNIYAVYNDNVENSNNEADKICNPSISSKNAVTVLKIDENGEGIRTQIINGKTQKMVLNRSLIKKDNQFIFVNYGKKGLSLNKITTNIE